MAARGATFIAMNLLRRESRIGVSGYRRSPEVTIRWATPTDARRVQLLAELDEAPVPSSPVLLAFVGEELWVAASPGTGTMISRPVQAERGGGRARPRARPAADRSRGRAGATGQDEVTQPPAGNELKPRRNRPAGASALHESPGASALPPVELALSHPPPTSRNVPRIRTPGEVTRPAPPRAGCPRNPSWKSGPGMAS